MVELEVPFVEKEQAKGLGARWNPVSKKWYVPDGIDPNKFTRWLPVGANINDRAQVDSLITTRVAKAKVKRTKRASAKGAEQNAHQQQDLVLLNQQETNLLQVPWELPDQDPQATNLLDEPNDKKLLLSEFLLRISAAIAQAVPNTTWLVAEISEIRKHNSGYFLTLVEYNNDIKCAQASARIWQGQERSTVGKFKTATQAELEPGIKVLVLVAASFHQQYGFTLSIHDIDPAYTLGNMAAKLAKIRETLQQEKIADQNKLLPTPKDFTNVAVISPDQAAGLGDFQREANLLAKHKLCAFTYYTATFQGKVAAASIIQALQAAFTAHSALPYDSIVIIRGGGAVADLAWLNDLDLARSICLAPVKIMAGIGHERDYTIIDEVAGLKFDTPSKVINYIFHVITNNAKIAMTAFTDITVFSKTIISQAVNKINTLKESACASVFKCLALEDNKIRMLVQEITRLATHTISLASNNTEQIIKDILALGPQAIQKRGFVIVSTISRAILSSRAEALQHSPLRLQFHDGDLLVAKSADE